MDYSKQILNSELQRLNESHEALLIKMKKYHPDQEETTKQIDVVRKQMMDIEAGIRMLSELDCLKEPRTFNDDTMVGKM